MEGLLCRWALALQEYDFIIQIVKAPRTAMQMHSLAVTPRLKNGQLLLQQEKIGIC